MLDSEDFLFYGLICFGCSVLAFCIGASSGIETMKKDAIENNCAEYIVDNKTGVVKFQWKNNE